jgi:hypothetical protein
MFFMPTVHHRKKVNIGHTPCWKIS